MVWSCQGFVKTSDCFFHSEALTPPPASASCRKHGFWRTEGAVGLLGRRRFAGVQILAEEWHRIVLWGKLAEITQQYLKKGMLVYIEGRIQTRQWEDKRDGQKRQTTEIVASTMRMLTSRAEGAAAGASAGGGQSQARSADADFDSAVPDDSSLPAPEIADEDIPF